MAIKWSVNYATGEPKVDRQHQQLFEAVNRLEKLIAAGDLDKSKVDQLVKFLGTYVRTHFSYEEICMLRHHCPAAEKNREAHRRFVAAFQDFVRRYEQAGPRPELLQALHRTAESWLVNHICKVDTQLRPCVTGRT